MQIGVIFAQSYVSKLQLQHPVKFKIFLIFIFIIGFNLKPKAQTGWIPKWSYIADSGSSICSPMVVNNIAIIGSGWENAATNFAVFALNISSGNLKWHKKFDNQILGISSPYKGRVIVSGRKGIFSCLEISSGKEIWKYNRNNFNHLDDSLRFNFNQPQWVEDLNQDGEKDIIAIYGGGSTASKPYRPAGYLMAIDGANGQLIKADTMPDGNESYATPLIYKNNIYFGSGGETFGGSFYKISIADFLQGDLQNATVIASNANKGFISAPTIYGETMIIPSLNETIFAYDLENESMLFDFSIAGNEIYSSIHVIDTNLYFTSQKGNWPFYQGYSLNQFSLEGNYIDSNTYQTYHFASPISLNQPNAMLFAENTDLGSTTVEYHHKFKITKRGRLDSVLIESPWIDGISLYSIPRSTFLLENGNGDVSIDCNNSGFLTVSGFDNKNYYFNKKIIVSYYELPLEFTTENSDNKFGGYLGNFGNGFFDESPCAVSTIGETTKIRSLVFPNPTNNRVVVLSKQNNFHLKLYNSLGSLVKESNRNTIETKNLINGVYFLKIMHQNSQTESHKILVNP